MLQSWLDCHSIARASKARNGLQDKKDGNDERPHPDYSILLWMVMVVDERGCGDHRRLELDVRDVNRGRSKDLSLRSLSTGYLTYA